MRLSLFLFAVSIVIVARLSVNRYTYSSLSLSHTHTRTLSLLHIHKYIKDRKERLQLDLPLGTVSSCSFCQLCQGVTSKLKLKIGAFISISIFISHFHAVQITCDPLCKLLKSVTMPGSIAKAKDLRQKSIAYVCVYVFKKFR